MFDFNFELEMAKENLEVLQDRIIWEYEAINALYDVINGVQTKDIDYSSPYYRQAKHQILLHKQNIKELEENKLQLEEKIEEYENKLQNNK